MAKTLDLGHGSTSATSSTVMAFVGPRHDADMRQVIEQRAEPVWVVGVTRLQQLLHMFLAVHCEAVSLHGELCECHDFFSALSRH